MSEGKTRATKAVRLPPGTNKRAVKEFKRLRPLLLKVGYNQIDEAALSAYLQHWAMMDEAREMMNSDGMTALTPNGSLQVSPWHSIYRQNSELLKRWARELGLTPLGRKALRIELLDDDDDTDDPFR